MKPSIAWMNPLSSMMQPANTIQPVQPVDVVVEACALRAVSWSGRDEPMSVMGAPQEDRTGSGARFVHGGAPGWERAPSIRVDFRLTAPPTRRTKSFLAGEDRPFHRAEDGGTAAPLLVLESPWSHDFDDVRLELRRLFSEFFGTFLLVLAGAGGAVVDAASGGQIGRGAGVAAPGLMVMAMILFMGAVSGAHLNPAVTFSFALRGDFLWRRAPGYILAQLVGAVVAVLVLRWTFGDVGQLGATLPGTGFSEWQAVGVEFLLTLGLLSVILGTASTAQNVGLLS